MNIRPTPNFAAAGSTGQDRDFFAAVAAAAAGKGGTVSKAGIDGRRRRSTDHEQYHHNQEGYDDGLVHGHGWAATES